MLFFLCFLKNALCFFEKCALSKSIFCVTNAIQVHIVLSTIPVSVNGMPLNTHFLCSLHLPLASRPVGR